MNHWSAVWTNDPYDDHNIIIEILCDGKDIATIKRSPQGLLLKWYTNLTEMDIPVDWISELLLAAKEGISLND